MRTDRDSRNEYSRQWYHRSGAAQLRQKLSQTANDRAKARLVRMHREVYLAMVDEEREALGLPPSKRSPGPEPR